MTGRLCASNFCVWYKVRWCWFGYGGGLRLFYFLRCVTMIAGKHVCHESHLTNTMREILSIANASFPMNDGLKT